jgi:hypothetical protein
MDCGPANVTHHGDSSLFAPIFPISKPMELELFGRSAKENIAG